MSNLRTPYRVRILDCWLAVRTVIHQLDVFISTNSKNHTFLGFRKLVQERNNIGINCLFYFYFILLNQLCLRAGGCYGERPSHVSHRWVGCYNHLIMRFYRSNYVLFTYNYFLLLIFILFLFPAFSQIIFLWQITIQFSEKSIRSFFGKKNYDFYSEKNSCFFRKNVF
jgi:hypothetical protein